MHYPGCKRAHQHGAAGSFVNGRTRRNPWNGVAEARQLQRIATQERINALNEAIKHWNPGLLGAMATLRKYKTDLRTAKIKLARIDRGE